MPEPGTPEARKLLEDWTGAELAETVAVAADEADELGLIFMCCHPALDPQARVALTLRCVCGLPTAEIAAAFLVPEATMAQRLVRAKRKIRQAGIGFGGPRGEELIRPELWPTRTGAGGTRT